MGQTRSTKRLPSFLPAIVVLAAILVIAVFSTFSYQSYLSLRQSEQEQLEDLAIRSRVAFVSHVDRMLEYADSTLRSVRAVYTHTRSNEAVQAHIAEAKAPRADAFAGVVAGIDRQGSVIFHTHDSRLLNTRINTDLEMFTTFRDDPTDRLFIDPTRKGRNTGLVQFRLVRPMAFDGAFQGIVLLNVEPHLVTDFYRSLNLGPNAISILLTTDAKLIAREPAASGPETQSQVPEPALWRALDLQAAPIGRLPVPLVIDGIPRIFYYAKLQNYPLIAAIGVAQSDIDVNMARPRRNLILLCAGFTLTTIIIAGLLAAFMWTNNRLIDTNALVRQANQHLRHSNALLERSNADLEQFAYVASHDLQTPLRNMSSFAQLLDHRYGSQLDADGREFIRFIVDGAQQMSSLVRDLLGYARVSGQGQALVPVHTTDIVHAALKTLSPQIEASGAHISLAPLPDILADTPQLESLFRNLLENALKYRMPGIAPKIRVWSEPVDEAMCRISVADNGIGIDPAYFDKIFVIFQRLHPPGAYDGTGIGLALCKRIVTRMGGEIGITSQPGQGAHFHFTAQIAP